MNKHSSLDKAGSLIERASGLFDLDAALRGGALPPVVLPDDMPPLPVIAPAVPKAVAVAVAEAPVAAPLPTPHGWDGTVHPIDRAALTEAGFIVPGGPVSGISEEFRIVKRDLLSAMGSDKASPRSQRILIASAHPGDGKTFSAVNLALSIAAERDWEVLLIDADFAKPSILSTLGVKGATGPGLMDAIADDDVAVEDCILRTDIDHLAVLPAGKQTNSDTEYLTAARTAQVLDRLTDGHPRRILIFDSPPALAASPASALAAHVGQVLVVVRADKTHETALRDALGLLQAGAEVKLLLNGVKFSPGGRRFGTYYGQGG